jgi:DNA-binding SARP family transcriptional activator
MTHPPTPPTRRPPRSDLARATRTVLTGIGLIGTVIRLAVLLAILGGLLVGLPYGLVTVIGWPLPDHVPGLDETVTVLMSPLSPQLLLDILACVLWPLWLAFVLDVLRCLPPALRGSHVPATGPVHGAAAVLVGAIVFSLLTSRAPHPSAAAHHAAGVGGQAAADARPVATAPARPGPPPSSTEGASRPMTVPALLHTRPDPTATATVQVRLPEHGVHDSLWRIACRAYGDGTRWPMIWKHNHGRVQADGRVFTNPDLLQPGWILQLPTVPPAVPPVIPEAPPRSPLTQPTPPESVPAPPDTAARHGGAAQSAPTISPETQPGTDPGTGISVPTGAFVGIGLAALITLALVAARLQQRRRCSGPGPDGGSRAPVVRALRLAHDSATQALDEDDTPGSPAPPADNAPGRVPELGLRDRARATVRAVLPERPQTTVGIRDGHAVALDLAQTQGLGLTGPGSYTAACALTVALLAATTAGQDDARVIVPAADTTTLLGSRPPHPAPTGLRIVDDLPAALDLLEAELLTRARTTAETTPTPPTMGPLVLVATPTPGTEHRLQAVLDNGSTLGLAGVLLGPWPSGATVRVRDDGTISATTATLADQLTGTRLFTLPATDTADLLALLHTADPTDPAPPGATLDDYELLTPSPDTTHPATPPEPPKPGERPQVTITLGAPGTPPSTTDPTQPRPLPASPSPDTGHTTEPATADHPNQAPARGRNGINTELEVTALADTEPEPAATEPPHTDTPAPTRPEHDHTGETPTSPPLRLSVLGATRLHWTPAPPSATTDMSTVDVQDLTNAVAPRQRELLVLLALHPDGAHRDTLISTLWEDHPPERRTNTLNTALSRLRRSLTEATHGAHTDILTTADGRYRLDPTLVEVDYWAFRDAVTARRDATDTDQRIAANRRIVAGYRGPLADGLDADWLIPAREATRRDALDAVAALARALIDHDPEHTLDLLETARASDPHNELLYRDILRLQHRLGRYDAIPRTLALLTTRLAELDLQPTTATLTLAARLQHHPDTATPHNTPT